MGKWVGNARRNNRNINIDKNRYGQIKNDNNKQINELNANKFPLHTKLK